MTLLNHVILHSRNETLLKQWHTMLQNAMGGSDGDDREKNKDSIKKELGISVEVKKELDND